MVRRGDGGEPVECTWVGKPPAGKLPDLEYSYIGLVYLPSKQMGWVRFPHTPPVIRADGHSPNPTGSTPMAVLRRGI